MALVHRMNDRVSGAVQALAELHKAGFIKDVAFHRYALSDPLEHEGISYESVMFSGFPSKMPKIPMSFYAATSDHAEIIVWKDRRGIVPTASKEWTAIYAYLPTGWFELLRTPITHWAYCEKDPRPWADKMSE